MQKQQSSRIVPPVLLGVPPIAHPKLGAPVTASPKKAQKPIKPIPYPMPKRAAPGPIDPNLSYIRPQPLQLGQTAPVALPLISQIIPGSSGPQVIQLSPVLGISDPQVGLVDGVKPQGAGELMPVLASPYEVVATPVGNIVSVEVGQGPPLPTVN